MTRILVTGALGQIGTELAAELSARYGKSSVVISDVRKPDEVDVKLKFVSLDVTDSENIAKVLVENEITDIFHMAAILSASGEKNPALAYRVNSDGTFNILEEARKAGIHRVMIPSTIGVFGPETPRINTPDITVLRPTTMYGITKVNAELLALYYRDKFDLDVRGLRFPGIISYLTPPSAGTTDYAVDIFYHAVQEKDYKCYLKKDTPLPMMYMPDALNALIQLFEAKKENLRHCLEYNVSAYSFTPEEIYGKIREVYPDFRITYEPDFRQNIAETWPASLDTHFAKEDWNFTPQYDLKRTVDDMIMNLKRILIHQ